MTRSIGIHLTNISPEKRLYLLETLPTHLADAGQTERLRRILSDFGFLEPKVAVFGPRALIADCELSDDNTLRTIQHALRREASILDEHPDLLWQQLYNRLYWVGDPFPQLLGKEMQHRDVPDASPWLRLKTPFIESRALLYTINIVSHRFQLCTIADETYIVAQVGQTLRFWDIHTGRELVDRRFQLRNDMWAMSTDGTHIVTMCDDYRLTVWDTKTLHGRTTLNEQDAGIYDFGIGGNIIAAATDDDTFTVWDVQTMQKYAVYNHRLENGTFEISPDGSFIVCYERFKASNYSLHVWNNHLKVEEATLTGFDEPANKCIFSPNETFLVAWSPNLPEGTNGVIKVWNTQTWKEVITISRSSYEEYISACVFSPDNLLMVVASWFIPQRENKNFLTVYETQTWSIRVRLKGHTEGVHGCSFSPDGSFLVSASRDHTLKVWDTRMWQEQATLRGHGDTVWRCSVTLDGSKVISCSMNGALKVWDIRNIQAQDSSLLHGHASGFTSCAISPDGSFIIFSSNDGTVKVWDAQTLQERATLHGHTGEIGCAISPDSSFIVSFDDEGTLKIWDVQTLQEQATLRGWTGGPQEFKAGEFTIPLSPGIASCTISPDNSFIVAVSKNRTMGVWDAQNWEKEDSIWLVFSGTEEVAISPDSSLFVSQDREGHLCVWHTWREWDVRLNGEKAHIEEKRRVEWRGVFSRGKELFREVAIGPDGSFIVAKSFLPKDQGRFPNFITKLDSKKLKERFVIPVDYPGGFTLSPDGKLIISPCDFYGHELKVWETQTGQEKITLRGHTGSIQAWRISPDGTLIVTASEDLTLRIWDLYTGREMARLPLMGSSSMDIELHPWLPSLICGGNGDNTLYFVDLIGITYGPLIVTAVDRGRGPEVRCPKCQGVFVVHKKRLGHEITCPCPECSCRLRVNPFVVAMRSSHRWWQFWS